MTKVRGFERVSSAKEGTTMPCRKTSGSACYDFYLTEPLVVRANSFTPIIKTGIKAYMPEDEVLLIHVRSSIGINNHITLANSTGIIDSDYYNNPTNEGEIGFVLHNNSDTDYVFDKDTRIIQGMFIKYGVVDNDNAKAKRTGATGSTGV